MREKVKMLKELRTLRIFRYVMLLSIFVVLLSALMSSSIKPVHAGVGDIINSFPSPGGSPAGLAWDGNDLWHADYGTDLVYKINITSGVATSMFPSPGPDPGGLEYAEGYLWISDAGEDVIRKLDPATSSVVSSFASPGAGPLGLAWDGQYLWNVDHVTNMIYKLNATTGAVISSFASPDTRPFGLAWVNQNLWIATRDAEKIWKLDPSDGSVITSYDSPGPNPEGLTWDGQYLWNADWVDDMIYQIMGEPTPVGTIKAAFLCFVPYTDNELIYSDLKNNWFLYGNYMLEFVDVDQPVTYEKLVATGADVVLLGFPGLGLQYTQSEADAIQSFLEHDANGIFASFVLYFGTSGMTYNNSMLAPLVGVEASALNYTWVPQNNEYDLSQPGHPIFANMSDPWISTGYPFSQGRNVPTWSDALLNGAEITAETTDSNASVITYQSFLWKGVWVTSFPDYYTGNEMDKQFVYNSLVWLALPARVVIGDAFVTDTRIDVSASTQVGFHAKWSHNGSSITGGSIYVNGTEHSLNTTGWISFPVTYDTVGKRTWTVTGANCSYITVYNQTVASPEITWDKVQVTLSITDNYINVGDSANVVVETATYQSDGSAFTGTVTFNDTLTKNSVGKYWYTAGSISDPTYGIAVFESNSVDCIFDKATITLSVSHNRTGVGSKADVTWTAVYQYPNVEDYDGFIELNDTLTKSDVGEYTYTVSRIGGDTYNITAFQSNTIKVIFTLDTDEDGMPDSWETDNGLNPLDAADASLDPDDDGQTNLQEYQGGTDPNISDAAAFPWLTIGVIAVVVIGIAVAVVFLWKKRK